jgi:hypothetical protein
MARDFKFGINVTGLGKAVSQTNELSNNVSNINKDFSKFEASSSGIADNLEKMMGVDTGKIAQPLEVFERVFSAMRANAGAGFFTSLATAAKSAMVAVGGLGAVLKGITRIGAAGFLLFFAQKAWQNNLGGIVTMFNKIRAAFSELMAKFNVAMNKLMKALSPLIEVLVSAFGDALIFVINIIVDLLDAFIRAPKAIQILVGSLAVLTAAFRALSANPFFATIGAIVFLVWGLYKGIKAIVDLFKNNSKMNMDLSVNNRSISGGAGSGKSSNTSFNTQNSYNVYMQDSGDSRNNAKNFLNVISTSNVVGGNR